MTLRPTNIPVWSDPRKSLSHYPIPHHELTRTSPCLCFHNPLISCTPSPHHCSQRRSIRRRRPLGIELRGFLESGSFWPVLPCTRHACKALPELVAVVLRAGTACRWTWTCASWTTLTSAKSRLELSAAGGMGEGSRSPCRNGLVVRSVLGLKSCMQSQVVHASNRRRGATNRRSDEGKDTRIHCHSESRRLTIIYNSY